MGARSFPMVSLLPLIWIISHFPQSWKFLIFTPNSYFVDIRHRAQINTPLTELHLNDEMVALLKSGRINNRLLCELATHKDFIKFLADIEIYV
jgi:hypothetical protein